MLCSYDRRCPQDHVYWPWSASCGTPCINPNSFMPLSPLVLKTSFGWLRLHKIKPKRIVLTQPFVGFALAGKINLIESSTAGTWEVQNSQTVFIKYLNLENEINPRERRDSAKAIAFSSQTPWTFVMTVVV